jgi:alkylation response protein AidB-like acyl-CoA dehydrogenase
VIEKGQAGLSCEREAFMGLRPLELCKLKLDGTKVAAANRLGAPDKPFDLRRFVDLSRIGSGALALGVGQAVLDYVKQYCNDRVAFGEPITNRQAVAFMIADIAIELDGMRLLVYRAAARAERGMDFHREAYLAAVQCAEKGMKIGTDGVQLLGGHGFIREHMVELWYRNLRALGILEGCVTL